jgi:hypothetical protein
MSDDNPGLLQKIFGSDKPVDPSIPQPQVNTAPGTPLSTPPGTPPNSTVPAEPKKKSFLQKVFGGGDNKKQAIPPPPPQ